MLIGNSIRVFTGKLLFIKLIYTMKTVVYIWLSKEIFYRQKKFVENVETGLVPVEPGAGVECRYKYAQQLFPFTYVT